MRQEAAHGRVAQHLLLRAPRCHVAPPRRRSCEVRRQHARAAAAPRELDQLLRRQHRVAAEVDVDDGALPLLRVQPRQALGVLLPQA